MKKILKIIIKIIIITDGQTDNDGSPPILSAQLTDKSAELKKNTELAKAIIRRVIDLTMGYLQVSTSNVILILSLN